MSLLNSLKEASLVNRLVNLEALASKELVKGDFTGSVTGSWVKLGDLGEGIVKFNSKEYVTKPLGFTSISPGTEVELSYAKGIYYSTF